MRRLNWVGKTWDLVGRLFAAAALIVSAPLLVAVGLAIRVFMGGPILFRQQRTGLNGRPFILVKFRSMRVGRGAREADAERITKLGSFLRASSLDELPTMWNVVCGDMALVGPRPLLPEYDSLYSPEQRRRLDVRPGITGLAQVNGRNASSWQVRLCEDVWYVDHRSIELDLRILARTVVAVTSRNGISHDDSLTMPHFRGNDLDL